MKLTGDVPLVKQNLISETLKKEIKLGISFKNLEKMAFPGKFSMQTYHFV